MPMRSRRPEIILILALLVGALLFAAALDPGTAGMPRSDTVGSVLDSPRLVFEFRSNRLRLAGASGSARHDAGLLRATRDRFAVSEVETGLRPAVNVPDYWESASLRLLRALAATESGTAVLEANRAEIRGVTSDPDRLRSELALLRASLPAAVAVVQDIAIIDRSTSLEELCRTNFTSAVGEPVAFRLSSADLRTSSFALLDKLVEVADDCRTRKIAIIGHTDASGTETWNRELSRARAQAVADYLVRAGIQPQRLIVEGMGSALPIADNSTAPGRSRNRRIEFEFR